MPKALTFSFGTAGRIIFGKGAFAQADELAAGFGRRTLIVVSPSSGERAQRLAERIQARRDEVALFTVNGEPDLRSVEQGYKVAQSGRYECVIALGGGSVIDTGKAIAGLLTNGGKVLDYAEVVGEGKPLTKPSAPLIAIPTTAGTGAEATRNSVITIPDRQLKVSIRSQHLLPAVALVDPELTYSLPPAVTASSGLDALTQLIEPYTCNRPNPLTDLLAISGLQSAARCLVKAFQEGAPEAREGMAYASLCGGLALANAGLGAVHGFAGVLGGRYGIPHGTCVAMLLPHVVAGNIAAIEARDHDQSILTRYTEIARILSEVGNQNGIQQSEESLLHALPYMLRHICETLQIPRLGSYGVTEGSLNEIVAQALKASSMRANPVELSGDELTAILKAAL